MVSSSDPNSFVLTTRDANPAIGPAIPDRHTSKVKPPSSPPPSHPASAHPPNTAPPCKPPWPTSAFAKSSLACAPWKFSKTFSTTAPVLAASSKPSCWDWIVRLPWIFKMIRSPLCLLKCLQLLVEENWDALFPVFWDRLELEMKTGSVELRRLTLSLATGTRSYSDSITPNVRLVPEPGIALMITAASCLCLLRRRIA